jgi:hypothetical protein
MLPPAQAPASAPAVVAEATPVVELDTTVALKAAAERTQFSDNTVDGRPSRQRNVVARALRWLRHRKA